MIKTIVAAAGLSIGLLMMPVAMAPAHAGINLDINIGKKQISCWRGRRIVEDYGYWDGRTRDCVGRNYSYFGRRGYGRTFVITVDSYRKRVVDVRRIYY